MPGNCVALFQWSALGREARARPKSLPDDRVARWLDGLDDCFGYSLRRLGANICKLCAEMNVECKWTHQCLSYLVGALSGALDLVVILELLE